MLSPMAEEHRDRSKLIRLTVEVDAATYRALMAHKAEVRRPITRIVEEWIKRGVTEEAEKRRAQESQQ